MSVTTQIRTFTKTVVVLTLTTASIQAGVIYNLAGTVGPINQQVAFQLTTPDFANPPVHYSGPGEIGVSIIVDFACSQLDSSTNLYCIGNAPNTVQFSNQTGTGCGSSSAIVMVIAGNDVGGYDFCFPAGALGSPGVYSASGAFADSATLTVTATPDPTRSEECRV